MIGKKRREKDKHLDISNFACISLRLRDHRFITIRARAHISDTIAQMKWNM